MINVDTSRLVKPEVAEAKLIELGFIKLPPGSYFKWIQKDRFEMYKSYLSFKHGAWIPRLDKIVELDKLDQAYKEKDFKLYAQEKIVKEEVESLTKIEEPVFNENGDQLPF